MSVRTADIDRAIRTIDIAIAIGQFMPLVTAAFAVAMVALAIYGFAQGSVAGGAVASFFAIASLLFLAQLSRRRRHRRHSTRPQKPAYKEAASA